MGLHTVYLEVDCGNGCVKQESRDINMTGTTVEDYASEFQFISSAWELRGYQQAVDNMTLFLTLTRPICATVPMPVDWLNSFDDVTSFRDQLAQSYRATLEHAVETYSSAPGDPINLLPTGQRGGEGDSDNAFFFAINEFRLSMDGDFTLTENPDGTISHTVEGNLRVQFNDEYNWNRDPNANYYNQVGSCIAEANVGQEYSIESEWTHRFSYDYDTNTLTLDPAVDTNRPPRVLSPCPWN